jgi:periplasmic protein TonB
MDFARQQRDPTRHLVGITVVILLHVLVIYGLVTGLARKAVEIIKKPLTATIVEEIKLPPPPPPPPKKIEIPKTPPPPQVYVPPPDVQLPTPPVSEPVISAVTATPPVAPPVIAPPAPPAPPKPAVRKQSSLTQISGDPPTYPREAIRAGIDHGHVVAWLSIDEKGLVTDVQIRESSPPHTFDREVIRALKEWKFAPDGTRYIGEVDINFNLKD